MSDAKRMPTGHVSQRADAALRAQRAWAARVAGGTWDQVAQVVGFHDGPTAHRAVKRWFGKVPVVTTDESRALWVERMERLFALALRDANEGRPGALRAGVAIAQRSAAMLGLDAPTRVEMYTPASAEILAYVEQLRARAQIADEVEPEIVEIESTATDVA